MNNIVYGQAMENVKNGIDVKLVSKKTKQKQLKRKKTISAIKHQNHAICHKNYLTKMLLQYVKVKLH